MRLTVPCPEPPTARLVGLSPTLDVVSTVFAGSHDCTRVRPPEIVSVTVAMFIASLNVTTMLSVSPTPVAPLTGLVDTMNGLIPIVVKLHGFGFGPGSRGFPAVS